MKKIKYLSRISSLVSHHPGPCPVIPTGLCQLTNTQVILVGFYLTTVATQASTTTGRHLEINLKYFAATGPRVWKKIWHFHNKFSWTKVYLMQGYPLSGTGDLRHEPGRYFRTFTIHISLAIIIQSRQSFNLIGIIRIRTSHVLYRTLTLWSDIPR